MNCTEFFRAAHCACRPIFFRLAAFAAAFVALVVALRHVDAAPPNVVVFVVDDLGMMDIGANNPDTFYETPAIDALAKRGARFTSGYAACPVCSPTRAALMTGNYPVRSGITDFINPGGGNQPENWKRDTLMLPAPYRDRLALEYVTLAERFKAAGYKTFFAGKWHLGPEGFYPEDQGFDVNMGGYQYGGPYGGRKYFSPYGNPRLSDGPDGEHLPDRLASETVKFIEANREKPFLVYFSFYSVHTPLMAPEELVKKYREKQRDISREGPAWGREREREVRLVQDHAVYAGMVEAMDSAVGKVVDALDEFGLSDNTMIVFTSDNGGLSTSEGHPTSNLPYRAGKGWLYEGGVRVPWIIVPPGGLREAIAVDTPICSIDLVPTLLAAAGIETKETFDGVNVLSLVTNDNAAIEERPLYWHYPHYGNQGGAPGGAVREGDWKLIEWYEDGTLELFHLRDDPAEKNNLVETHPERAEALHKKLEEWRKATKAIMPTKK